MIVAECGLLTMSKQTAWLLPFRLVIFSPREVAIGCGDALGQHVADLCAAARVGAGKQLAINAAARGGEVAVAVLDAQGREHAGYRKVECALADSDAVRQRVTWRECQTLAALQGQPIRLKLSLRSASLHSFAIS